MHCRYRLIIIFCMGHKMDVVMCKQFSFVHMGHVTLCFWPWPVKNYQDCLLWPSYLWPNNGPLPLQTISWAKFGPQLAWAKFGPQVEEEFPPNFPPSMPRIISHQISPLMSSHHNTTPTNHCSHQQLHSC
jgi:hypothetical protein